MGNEIEKKFNLVSCQITNLFCLTDFTMQMTLLASSAPFARHPRYSSAYCCRPSPLSKYVLAWPIPTKSLMVEIFVSGLIAKESTFRS